MSMLVLGSHTYEILPTGGYQIDGTYVPKDVFDEASQRALREQDEMASYLKDGETPSACVARNRRDVDLALGLVQQSMAAAQLAVAALNLLVVALEEPEDQHALLVAVIAAKQTLQALTTQTPPPSHAPSSQA